MSFYSFFKQCIYWVLLSSAFLSVAHANPSAEVLFRKKSDQFILKAFNSHKLENLSWQIQTLQTKRLHDKKVFIFSNRLKNFQTFLPLIIGCSGTIILEDENSFMSGGKMYRIVYENYYLMDPTKYTQYRLPDRLSERYFLFLPDGSYRLTNGVVSIQPLVSFDDLRVIAIDAFDMNNPETFLTPKSALYLVNDALVVPEKSFFLSGTFLGAYNLSDYVVFRLPNSDIGFSQHYQSATFGSGLVFSGITNRDAILSSLQEELFFASGATFLHDLTSVRSVTERIVRNTHSDDEKIRLLYRWIALYVSYDETTRKLLKNNLGTGSLVQGEPSLHSWLSAFRTRVAVCDGYSRLFLYMLSFAHIDNVSLVLWDVEQYGKHVAHAWNRIGDRDYDVTFASTDQKHIDSYFAQSSLAGHTEYPQDKTIFIFEKRKDLQN